MGNARRFSVSKVDANQSVVVGAFRSLGFTVQPTHTVGSGYPDLNVGYGDWFTCLVEVKDGAKVPSARKLTPDQIEWHRDWRGGSYKVETIEDVVNLAQAIRAFVIAVDGCKLKVDYPQIHPR